VKREGRAGGVRTEPSLTRGGKVLIAASVPLYLGLAWLVVTLLPDCSFLALVPAAFGVHSAAVLIGQHFRRV
jgi:hypothetical protein